MAGDEGIGWNTLYVCLVQLYRKLVALGLSPP